MKTWISAGLLALTCLTMAAACPAVDDLRAEISAPAFFAPGDSVKYSVRFVVPAGADSVVVKWSLGGNSTQVHVKMPPFANPTIDSVRFVGPPLSAGGSNATGSVLLQVFRFDVGSPGITKPYTVTRPAPAAPGDVSGFAFVDSAVVFP